MSANPFEYGVRFERAEVTFGRVVAALTVSSDMLARVRA